MSEDSHISEFVKKQPHEWLAGVQVADLLLLHMSKETATHAQRSGASILMTAMALQRTEGFFLGIESAFGGLGAARNQEPEADAARLLELFEEFRALAKSDTTNVYNTIFHGLLMRPIVPNPELDEVFEAFDKAFHLLIQPAAVNALLSSRPAPGTATEMPQQVDGVVITLAGGAVRVREGSLEFSAELAAAWRAGEGHAEIYKLARSLAEATSQDVEMFEVDENGNKLILEIVAQ